MKLHPVALTIAGSDSGAGAGIQADLKTFAAHGVYGCSIITLITAQSTQSVDTVELLPPGWIKAQLDTIFADFNVRALKTGALGSCAIIETVAGFLAPRAPLPLVIDPVMISKHGHALLAPDAVDVLKARLFPLALLVTPNLHEAAALTGSAPIPNRDGMLNVAGKLMETGCRAVLVKGGHIEAAPADLLLTAGDEFWFEGERIATEHTHGTGCTFSAAITAGLVKGLPLADAARQAKEYITGALRHGQRFGRGINPVNHFWRTQPEFGVVDT